MSVPENLKLATSAMYGLPPDEESIRCGTVVMEKHPQYDSELARLAKEGFILSLSGGMSAQVVIELIIHLDEVDSVDRSIRKRIKVMPEMRWLDFEHEISHIDQIMARFFGQGSPIFTDVKVVNTRSVSHRILQKEKRRNHELTIWQNTVFEFHARLLEFNNLYYRNVNREILLEHAEGLIFWANEFWIKGTKKWKSQTRYDWIQHYFPDLFDLREEAAQIIAQECPRLGKVK
jgi:hypothetical protein